MCQQLQEVMSTVHIPSASAQYCAWWGAFSNLNVLLAVRGYISHTHWLTFDVDNVGRLQPGRDDVVLEHAKFEKVRVVAWDGLKWRIDPDLTNFEVHWDLWVWEKRPLARLQWDPGGLSWQVPWAAEGNLVSFFNYSVKIGRNVLATSRQKLPTMARHWEEQHLSQQFLNRFWKSLWARKQERKITLLQWMTAHRVVPVGSWLRGPLRDIRCANCGAHETMKHCFWSCTAAQQVWGRVLRLLTHSHFQGLVSWGIIAWATMDKQAHAYESESVDFMFVFAHHNLCRLPYDLNAFHGRQKEMQELWEILSGIVQWTLWTAQCSLVFKQKRVPTVELVQNIWVQLVHTLKGQYDALVGTSDALMSKRLTFLQQWKHWPFFVLCQGKPCWSYKPPVWLYPPLR